METKSIGGAPYFTAFIDDNSRWVKFHVLKSKCEVEGIFEIQNMCRDTVGKKN